MRKRMAMVGVVGALGLGLTACGPPPNPGDSKNCADFSSQAAAQSWFDKYFPYYGDVARLDADHDHIACERN